MNILHTECSLNWGGQEHRTLAEAAWLNAHGHRAWIACDPRGELYRRGGRAGAPVIPVPMRNNFDIRGLAGLLRAIRRHRIDLIHTHGSKDSWICFPLHAFGMPVVRSRHLTLAIKPGLQRSFIYRHGARHVIATAEIIRKSLVEINGVKPDRIEVIGEFVDFAEFHPGIDGSGFRRELGIAPDAPLIGIIAMIRGEKGHRIFLDAAFEILKRHPDARFVMVGEGTGERKMEKECRRRLEKAWPDRAVREWPILMTGFRQDIPEAISALDVVVAPSLAEAQSRIIPEAFAMRKAVIGSRVGGIPELVRDGETGLLVPPKDGWALAEGICRLIEEPALRERLAANGYAFARERLALDRMMEKTVAVYQRALGKEE